MSEPEDWPPYAGRPLSVEIGRVVLHDPAGQVIGAGQLGRMVEEAMLSAERDGLSREFAAGREAAGAAIEVPHPQIGRFGGAGDHTARDRAIARAMARGVSQALGRAR